MTGMNSIECDVPDGMALSEWRRGRGASRRRRWFPRLGLRFA
jgi:hypothetical protein